MGAMYGITTSMQSSPERAFENVETFLDKEAIAYAQRVGASIRLATTTGYPGGFDAAASGPTAPGPAAPDPAVVFGKVGAGEVLVWGSRNVVLLDCPEASLGFNAESVLPVFLRSFLPNPAIAQEADAMRQNSVIESQQQSAMAQQRQQAQFSAMRQAVNTQRQAIDEYRRAAAGASTPVPDGRSCTSGKEGCRATRERPAALTAAG